ncbi:transporter [Pseudomonas sp. NPDC090203]|uniref:transporter n=1 Tax=Pseudomonas sp. NPDC090203 TaxID=3364477 RepID=UPI0037FD4C0D
MSVYHYARSVSLRATFVVSASAMSIYCGSAYAVDAAPGAYLPMPVGSDLVMFFAGGGKADEFQPVHGKALKKGTELTTRTGLVRYFHMFEVAKHKVQLQFGLPFGRQDLKLNGKTIGHESGISDGFAAVNYWLIDDPALKRYLSVTGYIAIPTGSYKNNHSLNMGNNRYANALVVAYAQSFGKWRVEFDQDVTWYGDNDEYGPDKRKLKQDPTYNFQHWLSYTFDNRVTTSLGVARTWGGESSVEGVDTGRRTDYLRARAGVGYWMTKNVQLYTELNRDIEVRGGYKFDYTGFVRLAVLF